MESYGVGGELLNLFKYYLQERQQRVILNGQSCSWGAIKSGVLQGSVLGPLLLLVYVNNSSDGLSYTCTIFADDTYLSCFIHDNYVSHDEWNSDLKKNKWLGSLMKNEI